MTDHVHQTDGINFIFPAICADAQFSVTLQRTLRLPDDGTSHYLPPSFGNFPISSIGAQRFIPFHDNEAAWLSFRGWPVALKIATGNVDALTGHRPTNGIDANPQNYCATAEQPWLDGFKVGDGTVRQFTAVRLGAGLSAEEQLVAAPARGGLTLTAAPLKRARYEAWQKTLAQQAISNNPRGRAMILCVASDFSFGGGARIKQDVYVCPFGPEAYDVDHAQTIEIAVIDPERWRALTGKDAPPFPQRASTYTASGGTWFGLDSDLPDIVTPSALAGLTSIGDKLKEQGRPSQEPESFTKPTNVTTYCTKVSS